MIEGCGVTFPRDITVTSVQNFICILKDDGLSAQTCNFYMSAMQQFENWLVKDKRIRENLLCSFSSWKFVSLMDSCFVGFVGQEVSTV